jgi:tetratricopeptide (TPR) repeat protein
MINFFKKKEKEQPLKEANVSAIVLNPIVMKDSTDKEPNIGSNSLVERKGFDNSIKNDVSIDVQIYNDVYSAQEILLQEAKSILEKAIDVNQEKYVLLEEMNRLGFANAEEVKAFTEYKQKMQKQKDISEAIKYYKETYPFNKFINEESVDVICKKYGLVLSTVDNYIAEIPLKNQKEIISFRVKEKDVRIPYEAFRNFRPRLMSLRYPMSVDFINEKEVDNMVCGKDLLIIAPKHKFKKGLVQEGNVLKIDDPIVLQPVKHGYCIVSSWGLEAGDELVVNEINN